MITPMNFIAPVIFAVAFVAIMQHVREPMRQKLNAIIVAGAGAAYLAGGLGVWEFIYTTAATVIAYNGLRSYKFIGLAWLMHAAWDLAHHFYGNPIIVFQPESSLGCAMFDTAIAVWFIMGAPIFFKPGSTKKIHG